MELTKPEDIKYTFCWHCIHYTGLCPHCNGNACSCFCQGNVIEEFKGRTQDEMPCHLSKYWEALKIAKETGLQPTVVTEEEITAHLNRMRAYYASLTPEKREKNEGFGIGHGLLDEEDYWQITKHAKLIDMEIPTLEEFGKEVDVVPNYNCNTGKGFTEQTRIPIVDPLGWADLQSYENDRIPWVEYINRREISDCDYRIFHSEDRRHGDFICVGEAKLQEQIRLHSGPHCYKTAIVIENNGGDYVTVLIQDEGLNVSYYAYNRAQSLDAEQKQREHREKMAKRMEEENNESDS